MSLPRFHVPDVVPGMARIVLPEHAAHHAHEVLRLRPGDSVHVFDGRGIEFEAIMDVVHRKEVAVLLGASVTPRPESPLRVTLAVAPLKGDRMELVIQKAVELGVTEIRAVVTIRTDAAARPALRGSRQERWEKVASGAAEQCGRAVVPDVLPTTTLDELLPAPFDGRRLIFLETPGVPGLPREPAPASVLLLIGPPGGFEEREVEAARAAAFEPASLGPRVLRTETAAVAALTAAQLLWGDLG
jgi:16S rRNA (uracil1498-N3)-methyltransferase